MSLSVLHNIPPGRMLVQIETRESPIEVVHQILIKVLSGARVADGRSLPGDRGRRRTRDNATAGCPSRPVRGATLLEVRAEPLRGRRICRPASTSRRCLPFGPDAVFVHPVDVLGLGSGSEPRGVAP